MLISRVGIHRSRRFGVRNGPSSWARCGFGTTPVDLKDRMNDWKNDLNKKLPSTITENPMIQASTRGIGQVIFLNSPMSGGILLGGLMFGDPYLGLLATLGTVSATGTAKIIGLDKGAWNDGLWGYNGCLVGCAAAVFGPANIIAATTSTLIGAAATPVLAASLKDFMGPVPQWTFAFNIVALTSLLRTRPLLPDVTSIPPDVATANAVSSSGFFDILMSPLKGISQIFVVENSLSGAAIVGGIYIYSPGLAAHAVAGSTIGTMVGGMLGADMSELGMGLWGFNSALTSMAVGTFFVHSTPVIALSAGGAAATAAVFGAMKTVFGAYGSPCLTLPFCFTMSTCYVLGNHIPGLVFAESPHSPEQNQPKLK